MTDTTTETTETPTDTPTTDTNPPEPEVTEQPAEDTNAAFQAEVDLSAQILEALMGRIGTVDENDPYLKLYVYGAPGAGKTTWTASSPDFLLYNVEKGAKVLKGHKDKITGISDVMEYTSSFQATQLVKFLKEKNPAFAKYKTFIVDSGSELQTKYNKELIQAAVKADPTHNPSQMPENGWNMSTQFMKDFFDELRQLEMHVIVTGHATESEDKTTGRRIIRPNLTPKVAEAMAGIFDAILFLERVEEEDGIVKRSLRVNPATRPVNITAKNRIPALTESVYADTGFGDILTAYLSQ